MFCLCWRLLLWRKSFGLLFLCPFVFLSLAAAARGTRRCGHWGCEGQRRRQGLLALCKGRMLYFCPLLPWAHLRSRRCSLGPAMLWFSILCCALAPSRLNVTVWGPFVGVPWWQYRCSELSVSSAERKKALLGHAMSHPPVGVLK